MARFNEILVGRYNRFLQKLLGMKGGPPAPQLASEIMGYLSVDPGASVENLYLLSWRRFSGTFTQVAVVAAAGTIRLRNPSASNAVAVIERATYTLAAAAAPFDNLGVTLGPAAADLAGAQVSNRLDPRDGPISLQSNSTISSGTAIAALTAGIVSAGVAAGGGNYELIQTRNQEIAVLPGDAIQWTSSVLNQLIRVSLVWRERFLEESERA